MSREFSLLPFNVNEFPNAPSSDPSLFLAGDVRANEQVAQTAMHTLFMREHNYWADQFAAMKLDDGETIYQFARAIVSVEIQAISYREFLPALLGHGDIPPYRGYRPDLDASISNIFATAAYRFGHTVLSPQLLRLNSDGSTHAAGNLALASAFFNPNELISIGLEPYLRGLSKQVAQDVDANVIDDVRNFLFGPPGSGGFDLVSLNVQRGRDHGLPSYNEIRNGVRQSRAGEFADITSDPELRTRLSEAYSNVDDIDVWLGLLCEDHVVGALVGPTLHSILVDQFQRLRDGDRFWYQSYLPRRIARFIETQTLAKIIRRNTEIGRETPDNVLLVQ
ncbi:MAG: peroxidase [Planctomycetota bacterium]